MIPLLFTTLTRCRPALRYFLAALLGVLAAPASPLHAQNANDHVRWLSIGDDLELGRLGIQSSALFSAEMVFLRTSLKRYELGVVRASDFGSRRAPVSSLARATRAVFGINANFFDEEGRPLGLVMSRGKTYQKLHRGGDTLTGVLAASRTGVSIVNRTSFNPGATLEAVQAGPRLLSHGERVKDLIDTTSLSRRAGVCLDDKQRIIFFCVSSGLVGISIDQLINVLRLSDLSCREALNLDGGGSAQFYLSGKSANTALKVDELSIEGRDEIPVMLGLFSRE